MLPFLHDGTSGYIASALLFVALGVILAARRKRM
jgi:LPXTG-motif cell wall-anchored protein